MAAASWKSLLEPVGPDGRTMPVGVFCRGGHPLLIVPWGFRLPARHAFGLYAPQTLMARAARGVWRCLFPLGLAPGSRADTVQVDPGSAFIRFLSTLAGLPAQARASVPPFVILAGNPFSPAPRFLVQVYDQQHRPVAVVKSGIGAAASELIHREASFLEAVAREEDLRFLTVPKVLARFADGDVTAFAVPYVDGDTPDPRLIDTVAKVMSEWVDYRREVLVNQLPAWQRLRNGAGDFPVFHALESSLSELRVHPSLFHGDFVPWNLRISRHDATWTVLDWERGERYGPPGWDWFHYVLQSAMLVEKLRGRSLLKRAEQMLGAPSFRGYAADTGLLNHERDWLKAYLLYCRYVLRTKEDAARAERILDALIAAL